LRFEAFAINITSTYANHRFQAGPGYPAAFWEVSARQWADWRWQWRHRITALEHLQSVLHLNAARRRGCAAVLRRYPLGITPYYLALIDFDDPRDPLRRQCLPDLRELSAAGCADPDPLGEGSAMKVPGFIQRYPDRAVVLATAECAVYCRHCTRKNLLRRVGRHPTRRYLRSLVAAVARAKGVREVIVSGGDPLLLDLDALDDFLGALRALPHVEVLRLGTRLPVVLPMRITSRLCARLARHRPLWINTHFNHPREITPEAIRACDCLQRAGLPVSNQAVLLRGSMTASPCWPNCATASSGSWCGRIIFFNAIRCGAWRISARRWPKDCGWPNSCADDWAGSVRPRSWWMCRGRPVNFRSSGRRWWR